MTAALQFRNLTLGYDRHPAVHHLDGVVESGALVAVVGPNGAGKSTLFKGIVGVLKPLAGRIERGDLNPQSIAYLPQAAEIDRTFPIDVYDMVAMGLWRRTGSFGGIDRDARASFPMPPKKPVRRHTPVPTKSNTEIGKLRSMSALCGR